jgi:SAM-dependent methyltransferase
MMGLRIDLGCGTNKVEGCIGVDLHAPNSPDIVADIREPILGLATGCAEFVVCNHTLEHLWLEEWRLVLREIYRLLEPKGKFEIRVPHPSCADALIHGHNFVLTPLFWRNIQNGKIGIWPLLKIDEVTERPNPQCMEFCERQNLKFVEWGPFLFDAFIETEVYGHKI